MKWEYVCYKVFALVADDGEVIEELIGDHTGYLWTVVGTKRKYYGEQAAKKAAERHVALKALNRASEDNGEPL